MTTVLIGGILRSLYNVHPISQNLFNLFFVYNGLLIFCIVDTRIKNLHASPGSNLSKMMLFE